MHVFFSFFSYLWGKSLLLIQMVSQKHDHKIHTYFGRVGSKGAQEININNNFFIHIHVVFKMKKKHVF